VQVQPGDAAVGAQVQPRYCLRGPDSRTASVASPLLGLRASSVSRNDAEGDRWLQRMTLDKVCPCGPHYAAVLRRTWMIRRKASGAPGARSRGAVMVEQP
jgi:hypothetical protein